MNPFFSFFHLKDLSSRYSPREEKHLLPLLPSCYHCPVWNIADFLKTVNTRGGKRRFTGVIHIKTAVINMQEQTVSHTHNCNPTFVVVCAVHQGVDPLFSVRLLQHFLLFSLFIEYLHPNCLQRVLRLCVPGNHVFLHEWQFG